MQFDDIKVEQSQNSYALYNQLGYRVMLVDMPRDGQYFLDAKVLSGIAKAMSIRWKQNPPSGENKLSGFDYSGLSVVQVERNGYAIFLPNGQQVAIAYFPLDNNYIDDDKSLKIICKGLALRYRINKGK